MNIVILAREGSERYPGKHLHPINGIPLLWGMVARFKNRGASVYIATGKKENNKRIGIVGYWAGAAVYHEEKAPEWDLPSRMVNMSKAFGIDRWVQISGDCPFTDWRAIELAWDSLGDYDKTAFIPPAAANPAGMGDRMCNAENVRMWEAFNEQLPIDDRRREQPWLYVTIESENRVEIPWVDLTKTPIKSSIDYPFEGAIADFIVRYLGRWPETDMDVEKVYREVSKINPEVDNTPPYLEVYDGTKEKRDEFGNPIVDGDKITDEEES